MRAWPLSRVAGIEDGGSTEPAEGSAVAFDLRCHLAQAGLRPAAREGTLRNKDMGEGGR